MQSLLLSVRSLVSVGPFPHGGVIFSGVSSDGTHIRVVASGKAIHRTPVPGEAWEVLGVIRQDERFGVQLQAERCVYTPPRGRLLVPYLSSNPAFVGIGAVKAKRLYDTFGDDLTTLLSTRAISLLTSVLTEDAATQLVNVWNERQAEGELVGYLDSRGINPSLASRIRRAWGDASMQMLEKNPYFLLAFSEWASVDAAAQLTGTPRDDERRLVGAVEAALYSQLRSGHTVTPRLQLLKHVSRLLQNGQQERALELALDDGAVVGDSEIGYRCVGAAALEERVADRIRSMLAGSHPEQGRLFDRQGCELLVQQCVTDFERQHGIRLNTAQRAAVAMSASAPFSMLMGGAGVGKTTVLRAIIDVAHRQGIEVHLMALAGRAAEKMQESTNEQASSIARHLVSVRARRVEVTPDSLIVIDESSMLDLSTMYRILRTTPDGARILLVGDQAQLAPIGFGLVFHSLAHNSKVPSVELTEVYRQAASTGIPGIARTMRQHNVPDLEPYQGQTQGVSFIECSARELSTNLQMLADRWHGEDWRILSAVKEGTAGIRPINLQFHEKNPSLKRLGSFAVGDPVIHLVNDPEIDLMNGTLGTIVDVDTDAGTLVVDFRGKHRTIHADAMEDCIDLAYAISVHKAQGSQFRRIAVVCMQSRLLEHSLIYTALTRGVEQVVLLGDREAYRRAVHGPSNAQGRRVGLRI